MTPESYLNRLFRNVPAYFLEGYFVGSTSTKVPISPATRRGWRHGGDRDEERALEDAGGLGDAFALVGSRARLRRTGEDGVEGEVEVPVELVSKILEPGSGLVVIDLDDCVSRVTGRAVRWADELVGLLPGAYWERSTSGTGLHGWAIAPEIARFSARSGRYKFRDLAGRTRTVELFTGDRLKPIPLTGDRYRHGWGGLTGASRLADHSREIMRHFRGGRLEARQRPRESEPVDGELQQRFRDLLSGWTWRVKGESGHAFCHHDRTPSLVIWPESAACWCRDCGHWWGFLQLAQEFASWTDEQCLELSGRPGAPPGGVEAVKRLRDKSRNELQKGGGSGMSAFFRCTSHLKKADIDDEADRALYEQIERATKDWFKEGPGEDWPRGHCGHRTVGRLTKRDGSGETHLKVDHRVCGKLPCAHCSYLRKAELAVHFVRRWSKAKEVFVEPVPWDYFSENRKRWLRRRGVTYYWFRIADDEGRIVVFSDKPLSEGTKSLKSRVDREKALAKVLVAIRQVEHAREHLSGGSRAWAPPRRGEITRELFPDRYPEDEAPANQDGWEYTFEGTTRRTVADVVNYFRARDFVVEEGEATFEDLNGEDYPYGVRVRLGSEPEAALRDFRVCFGVSLPPRRCPLPEGARPGGIRIRRDVG